VHAQEVDGGQVEGTGTGRALVQLENLGPARRRTPYHTTRMLAAVTVEKESWLCCFLVCVCVSPTYPDRSSSNSFFIFSVSSR
jgi:hypothetical protein